MNTIGHLPRLTSNNYQGSTYVSWTLTIHNRNQGWLNKRFHLRFREILLHTTHRYHIWCPIYVLMPDHMHLFWMGMSANADQLLAMRFFRKFVNQGLTPYRFQHQPYDNILREKDRERNAFQKLVYYTWMNPVRKGLVEKTEDYPFYGSLVPGYPDIKVGHDKFWDLYWRLHHAKLDKEFPMQSHS